MIDIWIVASLHLVTALALFGCAYFCYKLERRITDVIKLFDTNKRAIPVDPENVFIHLRDA